MKNNVKKEVKFNFWLWLHQNRIKVVVLSFLIIVPIALILTAYIGAYTNNQKVHFDAEVTNSTVFIKEFTDIDEIDAFELSIVWQELKNPVETDVDGETILTGGFYKFNMFYTPKTNYTVNSVNVTAVLKTPWTDVRYIAATAPLSTTVRSVQVNFNHELPLRPLWFVEVSDPVLYLKLEYTFMAAGNPLVKTVYIAFPLEDLNPNVVVPNN
ncbi:MAG: hypothetical protein CVV57_10400 [Tenericutes bacterium HGW-Tenericutes-2]|jgi:hypothetical protein|nr:MAG: hypothetical protein CVV57_10400 [Tenericutes bacterium HGW-Tenericutes-2]